MVFRVLELLFGLARVPAERDGRVFLEHAAQSLELIVRQGVHRIEQKGADTGIGQGALIPLSEELIQDRHQEAFGLATAGAGCDDQVSPQANRLADRSLLVNVERAPQGQSRATKLAEARRKEPFVDHLRQVSSALERRRRLQEGPLQELLGLA